MVLQEFSRPGLAGGGPCRAGLSGGYLQGYRPIGSDELGGVAMGRHGAKQGGNTGSMEFSPARKRRRRKQLRAQEARWAARSGPVTVTKIGSDGEDGSPGSAG